MAYFEHHLALCAWIHQVNSVSSPINKVSFLCLRLTMFYINCWYMYIPIIMQTIAQIGNLIHFTKYTNLSWLISLVYKKNIFESCLRFLNWCRVTWPRWIPKAHPFFWIRSGFCANSIKKIIKKSEIGNWMPTQNFYFLTDLFK